MTTWRMRFARWIPKAAHTHSTYVMLVAIPLEQWFQEGALMLRHTYSACLVATILLSVTAVLLCVLHVRRLYT
jgi:hypothetical protein